MQLNIGLPLISADGLEISSRQKLSVFKLNYCSFDIQWNYFSKYVFILHNTPLLDILYCIMIASMQELE